MSHQDPTGLHMQVCRYMLDLIFRQQLSYGQKVSEEEIAQALGVSRTPIREALRKLESDGLVEILPKRFAQIVTLTDESMAQLGTVKLQLDFLAAQLAAHHGSNADFAALEEINRELARAVETRNCYDMLRLDADFHQSYFRITGNPFLIRFQHQVQTRISLYQSVRLREDPHMMDRSHLEHQAMLDALYSRDPGRVLRVIVPRIVRFYGLDADIYSCSLMLDDFSKGRISPPDGAELLNKS